MAFKLTRKKIIIGIVTIIVVGGAALAAVIFLSPTKEDTPSTEQTSDSKYQAAISASQTKVTDLLAAGDETSVAQAKKVVDEQITKANDSQNESYIVYANLAKATFLIETKEYQKALDEILLPLNEKYGNQEAYKNDIYLALAQAYYGLGDTDKSNEYYSQVTGRGGS